MSLPLRVMLDTSVLRALNPQGVTVRVLRELVRTETIAIYIPSIVEMELSSQLAELLSPIGKDHFRTVDWASDAERSEILGQLRRADQTLRKANETMKKGVAEWLDRLGAKRMQPDPADADEVFRLYFEGKPPFRGKKAREDLPDGFIFVAARRLAGTKGGSVHFLSRDRKLRDSCAALSEVSVHEDLRGLFSLPEISSTVSAAKVVAFVRHHSYDLLPQLESLLGEAIVHKEVHSRFFPSDNSDATISMFGNAEQIELDLDGVKAISQDAVMIPVTCLIPGNSADVFIFKSDYYCLGEEESARFSVIDSDWNDHYLLAETEVDVRLKGVLTVEVKEVESDEHDFGDIEVSQIDDLEVVEPDANE